MDIPLDETELPLLLKRFYDRIRQDTELGPVFEGAVQDWPAHLRRLADFWSSVMLTSGRYKGNPMAKHLKHASSLTNMMFDRWLSLWRETTDELLSPMVAAAMQAKASRISESLQLALKLATPEGTVAMLGLPKISSVAAAGSQPYRSTPVFDTTSLPSALRRAHATKAGVWGVIRVLEGEVRYAIEEGGVEEVLTPDRPGRIRPQELHHVEPVGAMRMRVDSYDHEPLLG